MIEESDRSKIERAMLAYSTFNFAYKAICSGLDLNPSPAEAMRIWNMVEEVAASDTTLNASAAEIGAMNAAARENNARYVNDRTTGERELAKMLIDAREGFTSRRLRIRPTGRSMLLND